MSGRGRSLSIEGFGLPPKEPRAGWVHWIRLQVQVVKRGRFVRLEQLRQNVFIPEQEP